MSLNDLDLQLRAHLVGFSYLYTAAEYEIEKYWSSIL